MPQGTDVLTWVEAVYKLVLPIGGVVGVLLMAYLELRFRRVFMTREEHDKSQAQFRSDRDDLLRGLLDGVRADMKENSAVIRTDMQTAIGSIGTQTLLQEGRIEKSLVEIKETMRDCFRASAEASERASRAEGRSEIAIERVNAQAELASTRDRSINSRLDSLEDLMRASMNVPSRGSGK